MQNLRCFAERELIRVRFALLVQLQSIASQAPWDVAP